MSLRRVLTATGLAACAAAAMVTAPTPAAAASAYVLCRNLNSYPTGFSAYECELVVSGGIPAGQVWSGPRLNSDSNGSSLATGTCRQVTAQYAYYISVRYTVNGTAAVTTSAPFLCPYNGAV